MGTQPGYTSRHWSFIERWCVAPDTWALADPISVILLAGFRGEGIIDDQLLRAWIATDEPFWFRRIALVATTAINRGGPGGPTKARLRRLGREPVFGEPAPALTLEFLEHCIPDKRHSIRLAGHSACSSRSSVPESLGSCRPIAQTSPGLCSTRPASTTTVGASRNLPRRQRPNQQPQKGQPPNDASHQRR